ncbi:hypothetical protein BDP27DRAFT_1207201 [Rhodocollybia butyracea]|uniref:Oxidoreductase AflY n=1 Tax=Rhodocollybia butyracea TaxID=206335 RepID=A0A9P5QC85_9AGAR|nr:hypothetical protein BDP27DRAFT_1207201 [Rhodocollybia butyracea]
MTTPQSKLFPPPSRPLSALSPKVWAGSTPELLRTVQGILQDNQKKHHVFFNDKNFHNHIVHHVLALWALGANGDAIEAAYREDILIQRPAFSSPEPITVANFNDHLGDENFYNAYLTFFCGVVTKNDVGSVLEGFLFSDKANYGSKNTAGEHPQMLNRFLSGLIHPFIHVGYGIEFGLPGIVAEGLAQAAVHKPDNTVLIPPSTFQTKSVGKLTSFIHSMKPSSTTSAGVDAFTILARIMKDPNMKMNAPDELSIDLFTETIKKHGEALLRHVNSWNLDTSDPKEVERKIGELQWLNTLIYAVAGFKDGKDAFNADFFYMHLVTSSLFLPTLVVHLSPRSQEAFLRSYFGICLSVYIARGSPMLDIESFFNAKVTGPSTNTGNSLTSSTSPRLQLPPSSPSLTSSPNPWFPIIEQTILHPDEHLCKLQRSLAHYSSLYGWKPAGLFEGRTELPGAQRIDGTLFIRAAELTAVRLGREYERDATGFWDRKGFYSSPRGKL